MKIYTEEEFLTWFDKQPATRPVNLFNSQVRESCVPCVIGAFMLDHGYKGHVCSSDGSVSLPGVRSPVAKIQLKRNRIWDYFRKPEMGFTEPRTFGDLKAIRC